jgi:hypothetical protein
LCIRDSRKTALAKTRAWDLPVDHTTSKGMSDRDDERRAETPVQPTQRPEPDAG